MSPDSGPVCFTVIAEVRHLQEMLVTGLVLGECQPEDGELELGEEVEVALGVRGEQAKINKWSVFCFL